MPAAGGLRRYKRAGAAYQIRWLKGWRSVAGLLVGLPGGYYVGGYYWCGGFVDGAAGGETVGQQATELTAFFQAHIDNLEGHALGAVIAQERGRLQVAQSELQLQLHRRARRQVAIDAGDAASEAGGADFHAAVFLEVDTQGDHRLVETNASVAALADELAIRGNFQRCQGQVGLGQTTLGQKLASPSRIELL